MKNILSLAFIILFASCQQTPNNTTIDTTKIDVPKLYYVYAVIVTNEPVFGMNHDGAKCIWEKRIYTSNITEEDHNPTEDEKYFALDVFESSIQKQTLDTVDAKYRAELKEWGEDFEQIKLEGAKSRVIHREFFSFDSYKSASISKKNVKQEMENKFNP